MIASDLLAPESLDRHSLLWAAAVVHVILAAVCCAAMAIDVPSIDGAHPAVKPLKFCLSVALLLGTLAYVLPAIDAAPGTRRLLAWILIVAVVVEMAIIIGQALRGQPSHFNTRTPFDAAMWTVMGIAAVTIVGVTLAIGVVAIARPLDFSPMLATAIRIGLVLVLLTAVSGFAMGGRGTHDGGAAGDLRVPHFFALHGLQALPLVAIVLAWLPLAGRTRWGAFGVIAFAWCALAVGTLVQALGGKPFRL